MKNKEIKIVLVGALIVGGIVSLFASSFPDGLEKVAEDRGFIDKGFSIISGMMPDYLFPGIENEMLATSLAGIWGTLLVFVVIFIFGKLLIKRYVLDDSGKSEKK